MHYKVPKPVKRLFQRGQVVDVCDRDLKAMSQAAVSYVGKRVVRLADGRRFRASDGWWIGGNGTWPFPSIRHPAKGKAGE